MQICCRLPLKPFVPTKFGWIDGAYVFVPRPSVPRVHARRTAFGGIFSVCFELAYHRWSPSYRQKDKIEDPLYEVDLDVDAGEEAGRADRERQERAQLRRETIARIERYKDEHPGSRDDRGGGNPTPTPSWPNKNFRWPFSTQKNVHGAAINGILAGKKSLLSIVSTRACWEASGGSRVWLVFFFSPAARLPVWCRKCCAVCCVCVCRAKQFFSPQKSLRLSSPTTTVLGGRTASICWQRSSAAALFFSGACNFWCAWTAVRVYVVQETKQKASRPTTLCLGMTM